MAAVGVLSVALACHARAGLHSPLRVRGLYAVSSVCRTLHVLQCVYVACTRTAHAVYRMWLCDSLLLLSSLCGAWCGPVSAAICLRGAGPVVLKQK